MTRALNLAIRLAAAVIGCLFAGVILGDIVAAVLA
jgi:hypothetical protein